MGNVSAPLPKRCGKPSKEISIILQVLLTILSGLDRLSINPANNLINKMFCEMFSAIQRNTAAK